MKKLVLAFIALAFAFAFSSCCGQSFCPNNLRCGENQQDEMQQSEERPYRWDRGQADRPRRW